MCRYHVTEPTPVLKVGPDGSGSYRYSIDGRISEEKFHNAASAKHEGEYVIETILRDRRSA
jgi:hypothetical protein